MQIEELPIVWDSIHFNIVSDLNDTDESDLQQSEARQAKTLNTDENDLQPSKLRH